MDYLENIPNKIEKLENELTKLKQSLPKELWFNGTPMYLYQGFWAPKLDAIVAFQNHFQAHDSDVFITSSRKTGTTWLKSLIYSICNREIYPPSRSPLLNHNPHELVPQLESNIYTKSKFPSLNNAQCPRLFGTHVPYQALPSSIKESKSKIIYIYRNPLDTMISSWLFYQKVADNQTLKPDMLAIYVDMFCDGKIPFDPFEDHVLGYWKESFENPDKVLFVKYEDLKDDPIPHLRQMAAFLQCPFTATEEDTGLINDIVKLCSFEMLKQVSENEKIAKVYSNVQNEQFYRKGVVGDWVNFMCPSMAERFNTIMAKKLSRSDFAFNVNLGDCFTE